MDMDNNEKKAVISNDIMIWAVAKYYIFQQLIT
jgi:hypothetical protein